MSYAVKEIFYTLQGEGANTGRAAVFCRFSGCNLWTGREADRETAICQFCDTDFVGTDGISGGRFSSPDELAHAVLSAWPKPLEEGQRGFVVCSGGEPLLQVDQELVSALHGCGFEIAIESNGSLPAPPGIDWICVSPKAGADLVITTGDELKVVFPQHGIAPEQYEELPFRHRFLQPMDGLDREENMRLAVRYCLEHPRWRVSLQTHKFLGIP